MYYKKIKAYKRWDEQFRRHKFKENLTQMINDAMEKDPQTAWKITDVLKRESVPTNKAEKVNKQKLVWSLP